MDNIHSNIQPGKYIAYEKIPENPNQWNLTESDYRNFKKTDWVVTEKIHGANFGIVTDDSEVRFAKRKEFLDCGEDFFGYQLLLDKLVVQVKEIFKIVRLIPGVQAIQTGVYYYPRIEYCVFVLQSLYLLVNMNKQQHIILNLNLQFQ